MMIGYGPHADVPLPAHMRQKLRIYLGESDVTNLCRCVDPLTGDGWCVERDPHGIIRIDQQTGIVPEHPESGLRVVTWPEIAEEYGRLAAGGAVG